MEQTKRTLKNHLAMELRAIRTLHPVNPKFFPVVTVKALLTAWLPYVTVYLSARILSELSGQRRPEVLWKWVIVTVIVTGLMTLLRGFFKEREETLLDDIWGRKEILFCKKAVSMDYADADKQETQDLRAQISQNENWSGLGLMNAAIVYKDFLNGLLGVLGGVGLTVGLFLSKVPETAGSLTILNSPVYLLVFAAVLIGINLWAGALYGKIAEINNTLSRNATFGNRVSSYIFTFPNRKGTWLDARIYHQQSILSRLLKNNKTFTYDGAFGQASRGPIGIRSALALGSTAITTGFIYLFTCLKAWAGAFDVGSLTQYVGAATALANAIFCLLKTYGDLQANTEHLETTFRYLDLPNAMYQGSLTTEKRADRNYQVEFKNVSFKYPGSETWALKNVSMKFQIGKRLAIVGENGSGKTTFIKLLCRLYDPQEGEILLNGIDIRKYRYDDYMGIFSIVFQDFQLISQSLGSKDWIPSSTRTTVRTASRYPAARRKRLPLPGRCIRTRLSSSWTSPPPPSTPWPRRKSTPSSTRSPATKPPSTSATACPAASSAMRFWSSTGDASSSRAPTRHCWNRLPANTPSFGMLRRSIIRRDCKITHIIICVICIDK